MIRMWFMNFAKETVYLRISGLFYSLFYLALAILPLFDSPRIIGGKCLEQNRLTFYVHGDYFIWNNCIGLCWFSQSESGWNSFRGLYLFYVAELLTDQLFRPILGKTSTFQHFQPIDGAISEQWNYLIFLNSLCFIYFSYLLISSLKNNPKGYKLGIQLGLVISWSEDMRAILTGGQTKSHRWVQQDGQGSVYFLLGAGQKRMEIFAIFHFLGTTCLARYYSLAGLRTFFKNLSLGKCSASVSFISCIEFRTSFGLQFTRGKSFILSTAFQNF